MSNIDRGTMLALFSLLGIKPGELPRLPTEEQRAEANRAFAERPLTIQRIKDDAQIALSHASLAGTAMGLGNADSAARHAGHAFAFYEALVADGCARIEGADGVPLMAHGLAEACQRSAFSTRPSLTQSATSRAGTSCDADALRCTPSLTASS